MKKYLFIFIIFISMFILKTHCAYAASISLTAPVNVNVGEDLDVAITADTGGVLINSIELVVSYDKDLLSFNGYSDNGDVVNLWIEPPHEDQGLFESGVGKIYLSGIIPNGVIGLYDPKQKELSPIPLVHLLFIVKGEAKKENSVKFSFISSKILENDGVGTSLLHEEKGVEVLIKNNPNNTVDKEKQADLTTASGVPDSSDSQNSSNLPYGMIFIFIIISGILVYKLVKYKL